MSYLKKNGNKIEESAQLKFQFTDELGKDDNKVSTKRPAVNPSESSGAPLSQNDLIQNLQERIIQIEKQRWEIRYAAVSGRVGVVEIEKAWKNLEQSPEYRQIEKDEAAASEQLRRAQAERDRTFIEGALPKALPKENRCIFVPDDSPILTESGGIVNVRPIPQKAKKIDAKKALFGIAVAEKSDKCYDNMKSIFHDAEKGVDVATDGHVMLVVPNRSNKKTWVEGRDGNEIAGKYPNWSIVIPDNPIKIVVPSLQALIDKLAGADRASRFVDNPILAQINVNGEGYTYKPEMLLKTISAMQGTGSSWLIFELADKNKPLILRDGKNPQKFALVMPMYYEQGGEKKPLIIPVELSPDLVPTPDLSAPSLASTAIDFPTAANNSNTLETVTDRFNSELQQQIDGTLPKEHVYKLGNPQPILQAAGVDNLPIELSAERLNIKASDSYRRNHPFDLSEVKDLPQAINNPIAVFDSAKKDGSKVILTELQHNGSNFVAVMRVRKDEKNRKIDVEVNDIKSIYPKDRVLGIIDWINSEDNLLKWVDKEKASRFISTQSTNLIGGGNKTTVVADVEEQLNRATNVIKNFQNPELPDENLHKKIPTKIGGVALTAEQRKILAQGEAIKIVGLTGRKFGHKYVADVCWNKQEGKPEYRNMVPMKREIQRPKNVYQRKPK